MHKGKTRNALGRERHGNKAGVRQSANPPPLLAPHPGGRYMNEDPARVG